MTYQIVKQYLSSPVYFFLWWTDLEEFLVRHPLHSDTAWWTSHWTVTSTNTEYVFRTTILTRLCDVMTSTWRRKLDSSCRKQYRMWRNFFNYRVNLLYHYINQHWVQHSFVSCYYIKFHTWSTHSDGGKSSLHVIPTHDITHHIIWNKMSLWPKSRFNLKFNGYLLIFLFLCKITHKFNFNTVSVTEIDSTNNSN